MEIVIVSILVFAFLWIRTYMLRYYLRYRKFVRMKSVEIAKRFGSDIGIQFIREHMVNYRDFKRIVRSRKIKKQVGDYEFGRN